MAGIILLLIASVFRGYGILNHRRDPIDLPLIATPLFLIFIATISTVGGLIGAILIGAETSLGIGVVAFVIFWLFSGVWGPFLAALGL